MNPETPKKPSSETLSRRQKLLRRAVPLALLAGGVSAYGVSQVASADKDTRPEAYAQVTAAATAVGEFGGSESDWGHGTAESLLKKALAEGVVHAYAGMDMDGNGKADLSDEELESIIDELPTYEQADQLLEDARYNEIMPDKGDRLLVEVKVTADSDKHVSYEVVDAKIQDVANNQQ